MYIILVGEIMIISNEVKKNIKVAIFSSSNSILDVVKNEIENIY